MKKLLPISLLCTLLLLGATSVGAQTNISGSVGNSTWSLAGSPYRVTGQITVGAGQVLTIEPGVDVEFNADVGVTVNGRIVAEGTEADSIRFLPGMAPDWDGLQFSGADSSSMSYVRLSGSARSNIGGGINVAGGYKLDMSHSVVSGNSTSAYGGAFYAGSTTEVTLVDVTIDSNIAASGGPAFTTDGATVLMDDCRVTRNRTTGGSGAAFWWDSSSSVTIRRTLIANNVADSGVGTIWVDTSSNLLLEQSTVTGNTPSSAPYGLYVSSATATVNSSIFWMNSEGNEISAGQAVSYSIVSDGYSGTGNSTANPLFADAPNGDYTPTAGSPAVDAGDPALPLDPDLTPADIGAFVYSQATYVSGSFGATTWTLANSPYIIDGNISFSGRLTVEPGVVVYGRQGVLVTASGGITANGTESDSIWFKGYPGETWRGMYAGASTTFRYAHLSDGYGTGGYPDGYGGVLFIGSGLTVENSAFVNNYGDQTGGAISVIGSANATVRTSRFESNSSPYGGALSFGQFVTFTVDSCEFMNNSGQYGGAVQTTQFATGAITRSLFYGNSSSTSGQAIYNGSQENSSASHVTVVGNTGTGVAVYGGSSSSMHVAGSIIWGNGGSSFGGTRTVEYSDVQGGESGTGNINADPLFTNVATDDYTLTASSPAIDAGDPSEPRDADFTYADMGAFAYDQPINGVAGSTGTTTWTAANSPYVVVGEVTVDPGDILTIEPGVDVVLNADASIKVRGSLDAIGTEADSIRFFSGDEALGYGGLQFVVNDSSTLAYARISGLKYNEAGAPIMVDSSASLGVYNSVIRDNALSSGGAGALAMGPDAGGSVVSLNSTAIRWNSSGLASGIFVAAGGLYVTDCDISYNTATGANPIGAAIAVIPAATPPIVTVTGSVISHNDAGPALGGGLTNLGGTVFVSECLIYGNSASDGGAYAGLADLIPATLYMTRSTVANNTADAEGSGGVYLESGELSAVAVVNSSILYGNTGDQFSLYFGDFDASYSIIQDASLLSFNSQTQVSEADPGLVNLAGNDFRLTPFSLAINAGDPGLFVDPDGSQADIGAKWFDPSELPTPPASFGVDPGNGYISFSWAPSTDPDFDHYEVYVDSLSQPDTSNTVLATSIGVATESTALLPGLTNGKRYWARAVAVATDGAYSPFTDQRVAVPVVEAGNALSLDGAGDYADAGTNIDLVSQSFSIEFWARRDSISAGTIVRHGTASTNAGVHLGFRGPSEGVDSNKFYFDFYNNALSSPAYTDTDWHHWAATYNQATHERYIFRDGVQVASDVSGADPNSSGNLYVGSAFGAGDFNGDVDELRIWDYALTPAEVAARRDKPMSDATPGLRYVWHFDDPQGSGEAYDGAAARKAILNGDAYFVTSGALAPIAPTTVAAAGLTLTDIRVTWSPSVSPDVSEYRVHYQVTGEVTSASPYVSVIQSDTTATIPGLNIDSTYSVAVAAIDSAAQVGLLSEAVAASPRIAGGGTDSFGYQWYSSKDDGGPTFEWTDISGIGTPIGTTGDDVFSPELPIGFSFPYYDGEYTSFWAGSNGHIVISQPSDPSYSNYSYTALPDPSEDVNMLAPYWGDLEFDIAGRVYYYDDGSKLIIQYNGIPELESSNNNFYQIVLHPNGDFEYRYLDMQDVTAGSNNYMVGWQNDTGADGYTIAMDQQFIEDSLSVYVTRPIVGQPVSGHITSNEFWTDANDPYRVTDTLWVDAGVTLTIEPGVDVVFDADVPVYVNGAINAVGTETDNIRFKPGLASEWTGLRFANGDSSTFHHAQVTGGYAQGPTAVDKRGGGMRITDSGTRVTLRDATITGNRSENQGGGVSVESGAVLRADLTDISDNDSAPDGGYYAGSGVYVSGATAIIDSSSINDNTGTWKGIGFAVENGGSLTLTRSEVARNVAYGAANPGNGAGLYILSSSASLNHVTVADNVGSYGPGLENSGTGVTSISNSIFWGNTGILPSLRRANGTLTATHTIVEGGYSGTGNLDTDPLFVAQASGDYNLTPSSPAVDAGNPGSDLDPDGTVADMGAYARDVAVPGVGISGALSTQTWTAENNPYRIVGNVTIGSGQTLTVGPGVEVRFDADATFSVSGSLDVQGAVDDSVEFHPGLASSWRGIDFSGGDSSTVRFATISGAVDSTGFGAISIAGNGTGVRIENSRISDNLGNNGGAIGISGGTLTLIDSWITRNQAYMEFGQVIGGGIFAIGGVDVDIVGSVIDHNFVDAIEGYEIGGGLAVMSGASAWLTECVVDTNTAREGGGLFVADGSQVYITGSLFTRNTAQSLGGAISNYESHVEADHTEFSFNRTLDTYVENYGGSVIYTYAFSGQGPATMILDHATIAGNVAGNGAAISVDGDSFTMTNSILWGNTWDNGQGSGVSNIQDVNGGSPISVTYSNVETDGGAYAGTGNIMANPMFADSANGDYSLTFGSPSIDAGDPGDASDPDGTVTDQGAYAFNQTPYVTGGTVSGVWTLANSPYKVLANSTVPALDSLTIEPGVEVLFDADVRLTVEGSLYALGTKQDSIRFHESNATPSDTSWAGLRFTGGDSSALDHVVISGGYVRKAFGPGLSGGGGVLVEGDGTRLALSNSRLFDNYSEADTTDVTDSVEGGGAISVEDSATAWISDTYVGHNGTGGYGGGVFADRGAEVHIARSIIVDNIAALAGGGAYYNDSFGTIENVTVSNDTALQYGGGLYGNAAPGAVSGRNNLIWGNTASEGANFGGDGGFVTSFTYTTVEGGIPGTGNDGDDPLFVAPGVGDYSLSAGSPAIDSGDPTIGSDPDGTVTDRGAIPYERSGVGGKYVTGTWAKANGPYTVVDSVTVIAGASLTIESGVDVFFDANVPFIVEGALSACGAVDDTIRFGLGSAASWQGLRFTSGDSSQICFAEITGVDRTDAGGAIMVSGAGTYLDLLNSNIHGNHGVWGAGLLVASGAETYVDSATFADNVADHGSGGGTQSGGALGVASGATLNVYHSEFANNSATFGGVAYVDGVGAYLHMERTVAYGNTGSSVGGVFVGSGVDVGLVNTTFYGNTGGLGSVLRNASDGTVAVRNSILWANTGSAQIVSTSTTDVTYSIVEGGYPGTGNFDTDPLFTDAAGSDFSLTVSSPAIDAGDPVDEFEIDLSRIDIGAITFDQSGLPVMSRNYGLTVDEGAAPAPIDSLLLLVSDTDNGPSDLTYTVTRVPAHGTIIYDNGQEPIPTGLGDTFTQNKVNLGQITYAHDGSESVADTLGFSVSDPSENSIGVTFAVVVQPVNDPPVLATNLGLSAEEGSSVAFAPSQLEATDADNDSSQIVFTIVAAPLNGTVSRADGEGSVQLIADSTFTQADIDLGYLTYAHEGSETTADSLYFSIGDPDTTLQTTFKLVFAIGAFDDPPVIAVAEGDTVLEGGELSLGTLYLDVQDIDTPPSGISYEIVRDVKNGIIQWYDGETAVELDSLDIFTQADVTGGYLSYIHDGGETVVDTFAVRISDGTTTLPDTAIALVIEPVNDMPEPFAAVSPGGDILVAPDTVRFTWTTSFDPDDTPDYELTVSINGGDSTITTTDTTIVVDFVDAAWGLAHEQYAVTWNVAAKDTQYSVISSNGPLSFVIDKPFYYGDVTNDGNISALDASQVLMALVGKVTLDERAQLAADVTGNAEVRAFDAAYILGNVVDPGLCFPASGLCGRKIARSTGHLMWPVQQQVRPDGSLNLEVRLQEASWVNSLELSIPIDTTKVVYDGVATELPDDWQSASVFYDGELHVFMAGITPVDGGDVVTLAMRVRDSESLDELVFEGTGLVNENAEQSLGKLNVRLLPKEYVLRQNYPNPFNPQTTIRYELPQASDVQLVIYNTLGQPVRTLVTDRQSAGYYTVQWDGRDNSGRAVGSGMYVYRMRASEFTQVRRMMLIK